MNPLPRKVRIDTGAIYICANAALIYYYIMHTYFISFFEKEGIIEVQGFTI